MFFLYKKCWRIFSFRKYAYPSFITQYINVVMSFAELSRMSQIRDRNIYPQTDQLYQPLRNALRKLTVSQSLLLPQHNISRMGRNMRSLSPAEVQTIKRNLYIPVNKELVPTRNIQKVLGKQFTAVDVSERVKQALTPEQFSRMRHGTTQEIIYEIKDEPMRHQNIYTSRESINQLPYTNMHALRESKVVKVQQNRQSQMNFIPQPINNRQSQVNYSIMPQQNRHSQIVFHTQAQPNRTSQVNLVAQPLRQSNVNIQFRPNHQSHRNIYTQPSPFSPNLHLNSPTKHQNQRQSLLVIDRGFNRISSPVAPRNESSKQNTNKSMTSITALRNDVNINQGVFSSVKSGNENQSKLYGFRSSKVSDKTIKNSRKSKDDYKYNLFSALDEAGNTNCRSGCFHSNEIVASKIQHNPWK